MQKIKVISNESYSALESEVNKFIKNKAVIDLQYQDTDMMRSVCILYDENIKPGMEKQYIQGVQEFHL